MRDQAPSIDPVAREGGGSPAPRLAIALTTMNSMRTLPATLAAARELGGRIVVVDSGSTDGTREAAAAAGAEVIHRAWAGHVAQKQFAVDACGEAAWILLLDSDEAPDPALVTAIRSVLERPAGNLVAFEMNRRLVYAGRTLRHAFQPEWRLRLFRKGHARIAGTPPHDFVESSGPVGRLAGDLLHDSWADAEDMLRRQLGYARLAASDPSVRGGGLIDILVRPSAAFLKQYALRSAWRDGWRGLVVSSGAAAAALLKHTALAERRGRAREGTDRARQKTDRPAGSTG